MRHRSSPTHASGIFLALNSFLIAIFFHTLRARPRPHATAIIAINDAISILSIILSYLYAGATPPVSSRGTCALSAPTLAVLLQLRSLPAFLPFLMLLPPPGTTVCSLWYR